MNDTNNLPRRIFVVLLALAAACSNSGADPIDAGPRPDGGAPPTDAPAPDAPLADARPTTDGGGDPPPVRRDQAGGATSAVALADGLAYLGVGPRLAIWQTAGPHLIGESVPLSGVVSAIAVTGDHAFVTTVTADDGALHVIDVSDPTSPEQVTVLRLGTGPSSHPKSVAIAGTSLYLVDRDQGLFELDITAPDAPQPVRLLALATPQRVQRIGDRVYLQSSHPQGLAVTTLDANAALASLGSAVIDGAVEGFVTVDGLLITRGSTGIGAYEMTDPSSPTWVFSATVAAQAMIASNRGAWFDVGGDLHHLDATGTTPVLSAPYPAGSAPVTGGIHTADTLAIVDHLGELELYQTNTGLILLGRAQTGPCATCVASTGDDSQLIVAESGPGAVSTLAILDPISLSVVGRSVTASADFEDFAVAGIHAYVADWIRGLRVFDLSDPTAPALIPTPPTGGFATAVAARDGHVYQGESSGAGMLRVFGGHPPAQLGAIATGRVRDLMAVGNLIYLTELGGLRILDVSDPTAIGQVGFLDQCAAPGAVAVQDELAIVGCGARAYLLDISDPTAPIIRGVWPAQQTASVPIPPAPGTPVALDGTRAHIGHGAGVTVLDVSDPTSPELLADLPTAAPVLHLSVPVPGRIVASAGTAGVYSWEP